MNKINLILAEDHELTRQTLIYELKKNEKINVLSSFNNGYDTVEYAKHNDVDVVLMDIDMPKMDGILATSEIKKNNQDIRIIMLTNHNEKSKVLNSFNSGANGYCVKEIKIDELLSVIEVVLDGGVWFDKQIAKYIYEILKCTSNKEKIDITKEYNISSREKDILKLIALGYSNAQIAQELFIAHNTVKNHVASLIKKLNVSDRVQIAVFANQNNLLD